MALENLLTYTEVDSAGDLTVDSTSVIFDTMRLDAVSYVYKDFGASYFSDFDIDFEAEITASDVGGETDIFCLSNTIGTRQDTIDNNK